jgi:hypothetical protein
MADLAKQLRQLNDAQRLRELANQYGYGQVSDQDLNALRQALPQMSGQAMGQMLPGQMPPVQMPQYNMPSGQLPPAQMPQLGRQPGALPPVQMPSFPSIPQGMTPDDVNAMMNTMRQAAPQARQMPQYMQNLTNPGQTMQQNYIDPAIIEQMYYRGLLSR